MANGRSAAAFEPHTRHTETELTLEGKKWTSALRCCIIASALGLQCTQFVKLARDCQLVGSTLSEADPPLLEADIQVAYTAEVKRQDRAAGMLQKMNYNDFLTCMMKLSIKVYPRSRTGSFRGRACFFESEAIDEAELFESALLGLINAAEPSMELGPLRAPLIGSTLPMESASARVASRARQAAAQSSGFLALLGAAHHPPPLSLSPSHSTPLRSRRGLPAHAHGQRSAARLAPHPRQH